MLTMNKKFQELKELYDSRGDIKSFKGMVYSRIGAGKTRLAKTCRLPVLVHSFDPGGTLTLTDDIEAGRVFVDTRFEGENFENPRAFDLLISELRDLERQKVFEEVGTYVLDSSTTWFDALCNKVLKTALSRNKGHSASLEIQDWGTVLTLATGLIKNILNFPCDVLITGHIQKDIDELTGKHLSQILLSGQSRDKIPLLLNELYVLDTRQTSQGVERYLITQNDGMYQARTRIGREGRFNLYEPPNIMYLLQKAGFEPRHKPPFENEPPVLEDPEISRYGKKKGQ